MEKWLQQGLNKATAAPKWLWARIRRYPKRSAALAVVAVLLLLLIARCTRPAEPTYLTAVAERRDLRQVVEAVGEVISERDLKLQFPMTGLVAKVHVAEGDRVRAGQELARLRSSGLGADVSSASAEVAAAEADLRRMQEGTRPEEIAITEATVASQRTALQAAQEQFETAERNLTQSQSRLEALQREAQTSLGGSVASVQSTISAEMSTAMSAVRALEDIWARWEVSDVLTNYRVGQLDYQNRRTAEALAKLTSVPAFRGVDYREALAALRVARDAVSFASTIISEAYDLMSSVPITNNFGVSVREEIKSTISTKLTTAQSAITTLDAEVKSLQDATANFDTRIAQEEASLTQTTGTRDQARTAITTAESALRIEEARLNLQRAGNRPADIAATQARLTQARAQLQRASERFRDTIIVAPIDGVITKVALKEGELLSTAFASDAAITMLGDEPFRVEMYIAEIDVPKVRVGQTGAILLDAFSGSPFVLTVSEVDPTATDVDGVPKYRAKLDFQKLDERLKIGMTGDAKIFTDERTDVFVVPGRAIIRTDMGSKIRVLRDDDVIEERLVTVGMEGEGGDVEIQSGLEEGDVIIELIREE
ncbi:MAG TPA: efflux RND transporter periplasmic adaptor subunit [Candidatus Peribacteraceae bacterium]|nr:efflux RND transporter periplasmic adaptor subunit [Candidatus Peribacteraceae bacterium]